MVYTESVKFEWDSSKNSTNLSKHGVSFEEAIEVFADPNAIEVYEAEHSAEEDRYKVIGMLQSRIVVSARKANREEKDIYEQER